MAHRPIIKIASYFVDTNRTTLISECVFLRSLSQLQQHQQQRTMTRSKRVQDRSKKKRVQELEIASEKNKIFSKILFLFEVLKQEPEQITPVRNLEQYRKQINLPKPHKISDFLKKSPKVFELYKDQKGVIWCGMTEEVEQLVKEEEKIIVEHRDKAAEYVTRMLMMSVDKKLPMDKISHFRRALGLPFDFRAKWVYEYPELFRAVKTEDDVNYLELVSWNPSWAITELEKKVRVVSESVDHKPGILTLPFPMKFPRNYKKVYKYVGQIDHFQKTEYLSPYADASGLKAGSREFDKRAVAIMHELLSFTIEKRLVTDHLTHFRLEFVMPQKLMRLLLKHFGIFYVSSRGKRFNVFLNEAYEGSELIEKCPFVLWKEKVHSIIGYRGKKKPILTFEDSIDMDSEDLLEGDYEDSSIQMESEGDETISGLENVGKYEMEVEDVCSAYKE